MVRSSGPRRGFTLVELLVVIGIIAVLVGILLPVIGRARRQAKTVACMASLRSIGQTIFIYAGENKGSLPYGFYRSDAVVTSGQNAVDEFDPNTSLYIWWSVLRSYMGRRVQSDNGAAGSGISTSSRGMKGLTCPEALGTDGGVSFTVNMVAMPDRQYEMHNFFKSNVNPFIKPARMNQLYNDNVLVWDVAEIPPSFSSQYVVGYQVDTTPLYINGSFALPQRAYLRYRDMAADPSLLPPASDVANEAPIYPGNNKEVSSSATQRGNIRWRHGANDQANFLFADGTVRSMKITLGTPGRSDCRGEVLHKYFRVKSPTGFKPFG